MFPYFLSERKANKDIVSRFKTKKVLFLGQKLYLNLLKKDLLPPSNLMSCRCVNIVWVSCFGVKAKIAEYADNSLQMELLYQRVTQFVNNSFKMKLG